MTDEELGEWFLKHAKGNEAADMHITAEFQRDVGKRLIRLAKLERLYEFTCKEGDAAIK